MSSIGYPFGWNWNSGVSAKTFNHIGSAPPPIALPYPRGSNVSDGPPILGGTNPLRVLPSLEVVMSLVEYIFLGM